MVAFGLGVGVQYPSGVGGAGGPPPAPPSSAYDPTQTPGLKAWWDPTRGVTVSGGKAGPVLDQGGGGYTATQSAGNLPAYTPSAQNGRGVFTYTGGQALDSGVLSGLTGDVACTLVVVCAPASASAAYAVCGFGTTGVALHAFAFWLNAAGVGQVSLECSGNSGARFDAAALSTGYQVFVIRKAAGPLTTSTVITRNGVPLGLSSGSTSTPNVGAGGMRLGGFATDSVSSLYAGNLGDVVVYAGDVGATESSKLSTFFKTAWAIS